MHTDRLLTYFLPFCLTLKGQSHEIFIYKFFASIRSIRVPDSLAVSFSQISQNSQSNANVKICPRWVQIKNLCLRCGNSSALLPTTRKNVSRCCPQCRPFFLVIGIIRKNVSYFSSWVFFRVVAHNTGNFSALWTTARKNDQRCYSYLHREKMNGVVGNNAEKCSNSNKSTNSKPYANLHLGYQGPRLMCFMKKSWGEKSRGTVYLIMQWCRIMSKFSWYAISAAEL
jgi:hypothetical protein